MASWDEPDRANDPTARTLRLLSLLQTHRRRRASEIAEQLGVSERTVRRDVDRLRSLGYPVDADPGVDGGYTLAVGTHVPPLLLDDDEAVALVVGVRANALAAIEGIQDTSVRLMAKLDPLLPDRVRRSVEALHGSVEVLAWTPHSEWIAASTLTALARGCRDREEVRFDYRRRDGEESRRLVQPAQLVSAGRRWYLVAWDVRRDDWRTFRVDRIVDVIRAGVRFESRPLPTADAATFVAQGMRTMASEHQAMVVVAAPLDEVEPTVRWFHAVAEAVDGRHTRLLLQAETLDWLASMIAILAVGFDVEVVEAPVELDALLVAAAARLASVPARTDERRSRSPC